MKKVLLTGLILIVLGGGLFAIGYFTFAQADAPFASPPEIDSVVDDVLSARTSAIEAGETSVDFGSEDEINILLLGLDSRKGNREPHCDAIHMFTLNISDWTMHITSVPRGTYAYIPPGTWAETEYYVSNACAFAGLDYGIEQIEKIVGVKADYYVTVGFSQAVGFFRLFDLPTTETLQWLRHRQSYAIGDPQRSHNQAVFMKDMILEHITTFSSGFSVPMQYVAYTIVDTDMPFTVARALLEGYIDSNIQDRPDDITLSMKPYYPVVDYHFDTENPEAQIEELLSFISPYLSEEDLTNRSMEDIQNDLVLYMEGRLASQESVADIMDKQLWLQIDDDDVREEMHFAFTEKFAWQIIDDDEQRAIDLVSDYILEKETFGLKDWAKKGKELLEELVEE